MSLHQLMGQPPLVQAIFAGKLNDIKLLQEDGEFINYEDNEGRTPLHAAAFCGNDTIVTELLNLGALVNMKDHKWLTPLHIACWRCNDGIVSVLIEHNADCNAKDNQWQTPLHIAAANNALMCAMLLVDKVYNINVTDRGGHTSLHHAAYNGHEKMVELLHSNGATVNCYDKQGRSAIHWACHSGHLEVVSKLVELGAEVNTRDKYLYTPLHFAAAKGHQHIAQYLLQQNCDINAVNHHGNTPLHTSCLNGHEYLCMELAFQGADLTARNHQGETPVHIAACSFQSDTCLQSLFMKKPLFDAQSNDGRTPLHLTAIHGRFEHAESLIQWGADVNIQDKNGLTTLHLAAKYGHESMISILLTAGAKPTLTDFYGCNALHYGALHGFVDCCRRLIQAGVNINAVDNCQRSAVHMAAAMGHEKCLDLLISNGAKFDVADEKDRLPIHYAANQGHYECLFSLVASDPSLISRQDILGCTPLHFAAMNDISNQCFEFLIERRADPTVTSKEGFNVLHFAAFVGNTQAVRVLLKELKNPAVAQLTTTSRTLSPLHLSAFYNNYDTLNTLLMEGVDVNILDSQNRTPLYLAAIQGSIRCVSLLLRKGETDVTIQEKNFGFNAIHAACLKGYHSTLELLLHKVKDVNVINARDFKKRTAIMFACELGNYECLKILLGMKADVDCQDMYGRTALMRAASFGHDDCVLKLVKMGANVFLADCNGKTAVHLAASGGHQSVLNYLLDKKAPGCIDNLYDSKGYTPLHWGCLHVNENCVMCLLRYTDTHEFTGNKFTPLHCAVLSENLWNVRYILGNFNKRPVDSQDEYGNTPLHVAVNNNYFKIIKLLLQQELDINIRNNKGRTVVAVACIRDHAILEYLVNHGGSLDLKDNDGNTPLHLAALNNSVHSVKKILHKLKAGDVSYVNQVNKFGQTALHLSAKSGHALVTSELLQAGASVMVRDNRRLLPATYCAPDAKYAKCLEMILSVMITPVEEQRKPAPLFVGKSGNHAKNIRAESQDDDAERFSDKSSETEYF